MTIPRILFLVPAVLLIPMMLGAQNQLIKEEKTGIPDIRIFKTPISSLRLEQSKIGDWGHTSTATHILDEDEKVLLAVNAGIFTEEGKHVGMFKIKGWNLSPMNDYSSFFCMDPLVGDKPGFFYDQDSILKYHTVVQNIALIKNGDVALKGNDKVFGSIVMATREGNPGYVYFISGSKGRSGEEFGTLLKNMGFNNAALLEKGPESQLALRIKSKEGPYTVIQTCFEEGVYEEKDCNPLVSVPWFFVIEEK